MFHCKTSPLKLIKNPCRLPNTSSNSQSQLQITSPANQFSVRKMLVILPFIPSKKEVIKHIIFFSLQNVGHFKQVQLILNNMLFCKWGTLINRITGWTYKATRLAMSKTVCTSCEFVWSIINKMWKFPSPTWPSMYAPESTNCDTYNAILTDTSWTVLTSSGLLWSTGKKTWKFPSPTCPTIGPIQIKRTSNSIMNEELIVKYFFFYTSTLNHIGMGLWDEIKDFVVVFPKKKKQSNIKTECTHVY